MSNYKRVNPAKVYEVNGEVCPLQSAPFSLSVANNQSILAAVSGKRHQIMGGLFSSTHATGASYILIQSASGGRIILEQFSAPSRDLGTPFFLPITDSGYGYTDTGEGIFADVVNQAITGTIFYITYTP